MKRESYLKDLVRSRKVAKRFVRFALIRRLVLCGTERGKLPLGCLRLLHQRPLLILRLQVVHALLVKPIECGDPVIEEILVAVKEATKLVARLHFL